jgi:hypothetical protein
MRNNRRIETLSNIWAMGCRASAVWFLLTGVMLGGAQAQTGSISGTVDAPRSKAPITGLKLVVVDPKAESVVDQKMVENGRYAVSVRAGSYEVFACDPKLEYEPYSRKVEVKDGSSQTKDIHLIKKPLSVPAEDEHGKAVGANVAVCLRHLASTCEAESKTDSRGEIVIPGPESHFEVRERGEHPCE